MMDECKPLINTAVGVRALEEMVKTMPYYPPGVLLFVSEEPKTLLVKGEIPLLYSWTSTGKRVGNAAESVIAGKAGFGLVPGAEIDGKVIHRLAITPGRGMAVSKYSKKIEATLKVLEITEALAKRKSPKDALDTAAREWDKVTERRGLDKQKAFWGEKLHEMKALGIEYHPDWAAKAKQVDQRSDSTAR